MPTRPAALALLALLAGAPALLPQEPTKNDLLRAVERQLQAAHAAAGPGVGCVVASRSDRYPKPPADPPGALGGFDPRQFLKDHPQARPADARALDLSDPANIPDHGFACGVVIDDKGFVLTPYHVVDGATKVYVHVAGGGSYADVHAGDARTDLAVLKLLTPPPGLKALKFGDVRLGADRGGPTVARGKLVVLVAHAYTANVALDRPSAALGSLTNVHRFIPTAASPKSESYYYHGPLLEHDAKLHAGVSGAALLSLDGELVGLTTAAPPLGLGERTPDYAFPLDDRLRRVLAVLRRGEEVEYGYLGVYMPTDAGAAAVQVNDVVPLGPADQAGVLRGDVITHVDGAPVPRYEDLLTHVGSALAGTKVRLTVRRNRVEAHELTVTLGKMRNDQPRVTSARPDPVFGLRVDHGVILAQPKDQRLNLQILAEGVPQGVSVADVAADSPAGAAFKKVGDNPQRWLITHVNGAAVSTPREFYDAAKGQKAVKLTLTDPTEPRAKRQTREVTLP